MISILLPGGVGGDVEALDGQQVGQPGVEVVVGRRALGDDGDEIAGLLPQEQAVEFAFAEEGDLAPEQVVDAP